MATSSGKPSQQGTDQHQMLMPVLLNNTVLFYSASVQQPPDTSVKRCEGTGGHQEQVCRVKGLYHVQVNAKTLTQLPACSARSEHRTREHP